MRTASTPSSNRPFRSSPARAARGYDAPFTDFAEISLTHYWNWTGFPVVALPAGIGRCGLPVGVSLVGRPGADWDLLAAGAALESQLA